MAAPNIGFALVRKAPLLQQAFEASPVAVRSAQELQLFRNSLSSVVPSQYAGIGRYPLNADYPYVPPGWQWAETKTKEIDDSRAVALLRSALGIMDGEFPNEEWLIDGPWLIQRLDLAREIRRISKFSDELEIIEVARYPNRTNPRIWPQRCPKPATRQGAVDRLAISGSFTVGRRPLLYQ
jgi:hypothetical protein